MSTDSKWAALRQGLSKAHVARDIDNALATARPGIEAEVVADYVATLVKNGLPVTVTAPDGSVYIVREGENLTPEPLCPCRGLCHHGPKPCSYECFTAEGA